MRLVVICSTYANQAACNQGSGITPIHLQTSMRFTGSAFVVNILVKTVRKLQHNNIMMIIMIMQFQAASMFVLAEFPCMTVAIK